MALSPSSNPPIRVAYCPPGLTGQDYPFGLLGTCKKIGKEAWHFLFEPREFRIDCVRGKRIIDTTSNRLHYESRLSEFIKCTNYKQGLHATRKIVFAYHKSEPTLPPLILRKSQANELLDFADLVVRLELLPKRPFYTLNVDRQLSRAFDRRRGAISNAMIDLDRKTLVNLDPESGPKRLSKSMFGNIKDAFYGVCGRL